MPKEDDPLWYKDAVIYELHVKAFRDSNGDGAGDLRGLVNKLDYLQDLGVTAIWLLPFYPSPMRDDGYDIADYTGIHSAYGDMRDFRDLLKNAHQRGLRVITELVLNHTSNQHPWFQRSRRAPKDSPLRDFYVWSDTPDRYADARIIFKDFEHSNWSWDPVAKAYFWHRFYEHQPDLNFENPRVQEQMRRTIDFWLEMGVDGLRLDAIPYIFEREGTNCENLPETHEYIRQLRAYVDEHYKNRVFIAEANQWPEDTAAYFGKGDECHMAFNFPLMPRLYVALQTEDRFPIADIMDTQPVIPENCQWATFLRNHDELTLEMVTDEERDYMYRYFATDPRAKINLGIRRRLAPLLYNHRRRIELMHILLFSLPGTPVIYYGDEIGMGDNFYLGDRDGVRTPMQWSPDRNAGFSSANPQSLYLPLIIDPEYHYEVVNVENQQRNPSSLLWWMKRVIGMRKRHRAFGRGSLNLLSPPNNRVLAFTRECERETILVVANLSRYAQPVALDLSRFEGRIPQELFSRNNFPVISGNPYVLTLAPHDHFWFLLTEAEAPVEIKSAVTPSIAIEHLSEAFEGRARQTLEQTILPSYLRNCRWFSGKGRSLSRLEIVEAAQVGTSDDAAQLLLLRCHYPEGEPEQYLLPLVLATGPEAQRVCEQFPNAVVAAIQSEKSSGILMDGVFSPSFRRFLLEVVCSRKTIRGSGGRFAGAPVKRCGRYLESGKLPESSRLLGAEQTNTSIGYGQNLILKVYRKIEEGPHPDAEMVRALTEEGDFSHTPPYVGAIEYRRGKQRLTIGLLQQFIQNEGDAWHYVVGKVVDYLDNVLVRNEAIAPPGIPFIPEQPMEPSSSVMRELADPFLCDMIALLGRRTAEMHMTLSRLETPDFKPEPFSEHYQRSVFQVMRSEMRSVCRSLERNMARLTPDIAIEAQGILASQPKILESLARITGRKIEALKTRIHGDYHLGQVIFTGKDFMIIDFEGEPLRPLSERRLKRSPLRDVAGMIHSFYYAGFAAFFTRKATDPARAPDLEPWLKPWYYYISNQFMAGYMDVARQADFIPKSHADMRMLLDAFVLQKALYELGYELNNRPDWIPIPIRGIQNILAGE